MSNEVTFVPSHNDVKQVHRRMESCEGPELHEGGTESKKYSELNTRLIYRLL